MDTVAAIFDTVTGWLADRAIPCLMSVYYEKGLRNAFFTGFLTLGGFLFSLKTFILVKLKESLYDSPEYKAELERMRGINPKLTQYGPLVRLSGLVYLAIWFALSTSLFQVTLGLIEHPVVMFFGFAGAIASIVMVLRSLYFARVSLKVWFAAIEKQPDKPKGD